MAGLRWTDAEIALVKQCMTEGLEGWQERLATQLGRPVNAVYCAAYRLVGNHTEHRQWSWTEKCKIVQLREKKKMYFKDIASAMSCTTEQARHVYRYMTDGVKVS